MSSSRRDPQELAAALQAPRLPPVQQWRPARSGEIDIRIDRRGEWYHEGSRIHRKPLYRLFSTVLRRDEDDEYYLVTPVERLRIEVEDVPFLAIAMEVAGSGEAQLLTFLSNCDDRIECDARHPLRVETDPHSGEPSPYVLVRDRLEARLARAVFYQLADLAFVRGDALGVWSGGTFFALGPVPD